MEDTVFSEKFYRPATAGRAEHGFVISHEIQRMSFLTRNSYARPA